jgi:cysteinyl-tRNA synthetase
MVRETLGDQIDIHGGGADLIFPHHENEIAQSESLTGRVPFAQHWAHAGLVILGGGEKMAHSAENFTTLESILEKYEPIEVRYYLLATHYRSSLTFTVEGESPSDRTVRGIEDARGALARLRRALGPEPLHVDGDLDESSVEAFKTAMDADFNTPDALSVIFDLARRINTLRSASEPPAELDRERRTLVHLLDVLGLDIASTPPTQELPVAPLVALRDEMRAQGAVLLQSLNVHATGAVATEEPPPAVAPVVDELLDLRRQLRQARRFDLADGIRKRLGELGVTVEDKPGGESTWRVER